MSSMRTPRHKIVLSVVGVLAAALVAGCGLPADEHAGAGQAAPAAGTRTITDSTGTAVTVPDTVSRIADAWPAHNEVVQMLGAGDRIVATVLTHESTPWLYTVQPSLDNAATVFTTSTVSTEKLIQARPDVLFSDKSTQIGASTSELGIPTVQLGFQTYDDLTGRELADWGRREFARTVAYVPQAHTSPFPFSVADVVLMGRTPHLGVAASPGRADVLVAEQNMERLGITHLAGRSFGQISGGERQMVLIARALTQEPALLVMDEPTSNLDLGNQARVLRRIRMLADAGLAIVMISHAPDHAFAVASTAALLRPDGTLQVGTPDAVLDEPGLTHAYGEDVMVVRATAPDGTIVRSCVPMM
jgi:iron complex transport system ATP-binding protein